MIITRPVSPCIQICRLDTTGVLCTGCFRTLSEIVQWRDLDDSQREVVWQQLDDRRQAWGRRLPSDKHC
ncbi:hypothetical protein HNQ59_000730 [Chitinivorax tropicus]|uniref:DUF1289 domain-containing protein n=1 Tax=Chitinivorax tropicus TaxID=714531 RepID=A0A840MLQ5_9PROT|nr:DUF1289 domain-containing protein [Chitinivorax tropicus]MBB5017466.1 hypothetical protein [Chitinivorax tropicus]